MIKENTIFIPLGTRCNSASIINDKLGVRHTSYPFDWIDVSLETILKYIQVPEGDIETYFTDYFSKLTLISKEDGAWYPHELIENSPVLDIETGPVLKSIAQKYIRRYHRLHDAFKSGNDLVFLTVLPHVGKNSDIFRAIKNYIVPIVKGKCIFITINLSYNNYVRFDNDIHPNEPDEYPEDYTFVHINKHIPIDNDWNAFDSQIVDFIKNRLSL